MLNADSFDKLREIANGNEEALGIIKELESIVNGDSIMTAYEQEIINRKLQRSIEAEIAERATAKGLEKGHKQGIEQGIEQGRAKEKENIVIKMNENGISLEDIAAITSLSIDKINEILQKKED